MGEKRRAKYGEAKAFLEMAARHALDECLIWPFGMGDVGYGRVSWGGRQQSASTVVCEIVHGPRPDAWDDAAHECGDRRCVNGRHLAWKSHAANQRDISRHHPAGIRKRAPQFTDAQVREIRASSLPASDLAFSLGVERHRIWDVRARRVFASVSD